MSKRKWRGFRGAQPERARPPAASPQPCPAPHAGLPGGSRRRAPAPAGQQQMRAESRSGAQRRRGSARRGAHREAGGCVRGRTRSSGSGRSNALWRAVDAAEGRRRRGVDLALAPLAGEGHTRWRQPGRPGKSD
ncbi:putative insulin-like growth factor 2 antisense gene protein [Pan paniscus]|uniref:putative insulin-like growth factor 2 antisense gene protein n=1 Tax=Pan paniscus TaxID=9597 RepID=UPI0007DBD7BD|nr:putative insulin-like growth factor 2 antisense gene protein [Pan paniscus]